MGWNDKIIAEFRENNGKVGGRFEGAPMLLVTTAGRRTGKPHTTPVIHLHDGDHYLIFGANAGRDRHPDWYHNILAAAQVTVELGTAGGRVEPFAAQAVPLEGEERDRQWERQCAIDPAFRDYEKTSGRTIPVVAITVLDLAADPHRARMIAEQLTRLHGNLRAELAAARARLDEAGARPPAPDLLQQLRRHCLTYCFDLQMHHTREDGAFTAFERRFPGLAPTIARLREEHEAIEKLLARFETFLDRQDTGTAEIRAELERVVDDLEAHFVHEEEALLAATENA
ncbi:nitroreductase/quinone reductase family protein [Actinomadura sp. 9N215]|uniref:nitroreductase/quinone reductase family protein n=1 Tax=Actinomadura sp. 9N215 TaxID=3375150 RepID=UPI00379214AC